MIAPDLLSFRLTRPRAAISTLLFLSSVLNCPACLQGYRFPPEKLEKPKLDHEKPRVELRLGTESAKAPAVRPNEKFERYVEEFATRPAGTASFEDTTDYAVALVVLGRAREAVDVLLVLEKKRPGVYTTATNLGTAYELMGELEAAERWISTGIERNANSHEGTEWLHFAILRAKLNLRADPNWLRQHSVLNEAKGAHTAAETMRAIEYQLHERLHFVQSADAVVCDLFYQAALLATGEAQREARAQFLRESLRFGDWRKTEVEKLLKA